MRRCVAWLLIVGLLFQVTSPAYAQGTHCKAQQARIDAKRRELRTAQNELAQWQGLLGNQEALLRENYLHEAEARTEIGLVAAALATLAIGLAEALASERACQLAVDAARTAWRVAQSAWQMVNDLCLRILVKLDALEARLAEILRRIPVNRVEVGCPRIDGHSI